MLMLLPCDGLNELDGLRLAECLQRHLRNRQVPSQIGQLGGKLRVHRQSFPAHRAQQEHAAAMPLPIPCQVAQQVEGGPIDPLQIIEQ